MGIHDNIYKGHSCVGMVTIGMGGRKRQLPNRTDLKNYSKGAKKFSPSEHFDWGCESPACFQLGLSILANEFGDAVALNMHEKFTQKYICKLNEDESWEMSSDDLERMMMRMAV